MNWLKAIKRLLGRFWADIFRDQDFLLGVEYLIALYSKLTDNQYLNWCNGLIAANLDVAQANLPFVVLIETTSVQREWYQWQTLWTAGSASKFYNHTYDANLGATKDDMQSYELQKKLGVATLMTRYHGEWTF